MGLGSASPHAGAGSGARLQCIPPRALQIPQELRKPKYNSCPLAGEREEAGNKSKTPCWESVGFPLGRAKLNKPRCSSARSRRAGFPRGSPSSHLFRFRLISLVHQRRKPPRGVSARAPRPVARGVSRRNGGFFRLVTFARGFPAGSGCLRSEFKLLTAGWLFSAAFRSCP